MDKEKDIFKEIELNSWSELRDELLKKNDWIFRGVSQSRYELKTTLERYFNNYSNLKKSCRIPYERDMISQLSRSIHQYVENTETILETNFQKICYLQHFGAATRLLDFSYSPFIASFFALEGMKRDKDGAIYAINSSIFRKIQNLSFKEIKEKTEGEYSKLQTEGIVIARETVDSLLKLSYNKFGIDPFVGLVNPYFKFNRLTNQNGCFLIPFDITISFKDNLETAVESAKINKNLLKKYRIKNEWRDEALRDLDKMNINKSTLFPGVEGFVGSLNIQTDISIQIQKEREYLK